MGFGLLFLGYFFMFNFPYRGFDIFPDFLGFVINVFAFRRLAEYKMGFEVLKKYNWLMLFSSVVLAALQLTGLVSEPLPVTGYYELVYLGLTFFYHFYLLASIYRLATDAGSLTVAAQAKRNLTLSFIYVFFALFNALPFGFVTELIERLNKYGYGIGIYILRCIWLLFNLTLIYSAYMRIAPEGEEQEGE